MKKIYSLLFLVAIQLPPAWSQWAVGWQRSLGGPGFDFGYSMSKGPDHGIVMAGYTDYPGGDVTVHYGYQDVWLAKLDSGGALLWQRTYGGSDDDVAYSVIHTADSGYVFAGETQSNDTDVTGNNGFFDFWIVKLDTGGNIQWQQCLGGSGWERANAIRQTTDGGYIVAGYSESNDSDVTVNNGYNDFWIVRLDSTGNLLWQRSYGGSDDDEANDVQQTADGGFIVAGVTLSNDSDVTGHHGDYDFWIVKLDSSGNLQWQKAAGGSLEDIATSVIETADSGYIVAGYSDSNDGDVTGNLGNIDYWITRLDTAGNLLWEKSFGGTDADYAEWILPVTGGYVLAGGASSSDVQVTNAIGDYDFWIAAIDTGGTLLWQQSTGGTDEDYPYGIAQTADSGYVVGGLSRSNDVHVSGNHGIFDYWVVKLFPTLVSVMDHSQPQLELYPNPARDKLYIQTGTRSTCEVEIFDRIGQRVKRLLVAGGSIQVDGLADGFYTARISSDRGSATKKFVVHR